MKYKKQIVTGALAFSLLIGGSSVFAATPQDLGIKNTQSTSVKQNKVNKVVKSKKGNQAVGTISAINSTGFTLEIKNLKAKTTTSMDVKTDTLTVYTKNGITATSLDLVVGQKVIVSGTIDTTTKIIAAKQVKITTSVTKINVNKKIAKKSGAVKVDKKIVTKITQ